METISIANFYVFVIVSLIGTGIGLDLKKWTSWLYGLYGFLSGYFMGYIWVNTISGIKLDAIFAFAVMYAGAMIRWNRQ